MADRDAFGRDADDDALADMGWSTSATPSPSRLAPTPTPGRSFASPSAASPSAASPSAASPSAAGPSALRPRIETPRPPTSLSGPRRSGGLKAGVGVFVTLLIVGIVGAAVALVGASTQSGTSVTHSTLPSTLASPSTPASPTAPSTPSTPAPPRRPASLFNARTFGRVLARAHRRAGGRLFQLAVYEGYLSAIASNAGRQRVLVIGAAGDIRIDSTSSGAAAPSTFPWSQVDPRATARLARGVRRLGGGRMRYAVLTSIGGLKWSAYDVRQPAHYFFAAPNGRNLRRIG